MNEEELKSPGDKAKVNCTFHGCRGRRGLRGGAFPRERAQGDKSVSAGQCAAASACLNDLLGVVRNNNGGGSADIYPRPAADKADALRSSLRAHSPAHVPVTVTLN